jgi:hypothetical protein
LSVLFITAVQVARTATAPAQSSSTIQVIADRAEKAAVIVTTNLPFSEWSQVIPNPRLCKALINRLTDRAHIHHGHGLLPVPPHHGTAQGQAMMERMEGKGRPADPGLGPDQQVI